MGGERTRGARIPRGMEEGVRDHEESRKSSNDPECAVPLPVILQQGRILGMGRGNKYLLNNCLPLQ